MSATRFDLPRDIEARMKRAAHTITDRGGIDSVVIVAYSPTGHYQLATAGSGTDADVARRLRWVADQLDRGGA